MPTNTDLTPPPSTRGSSPDRPIVYLVNADGEQGMGIDLPKLLAPLWRWRWSVIAILAVTVFAAGWVWTRPPQVMHQMVIRRGVIAVEHFRGQLESLIIPGALDNMDPAWRPTVEVIDRTLDKNDEQTAPSVGADLSTLSFPVHAWNPEATATLSRLLRTRIETLTSASVALARVEDDERLRSLSQSISRAQHAYKVISDPTYVDALRGAVERDIAVTKASIRKQQAVFESLSSRNSATSARTILLQGLLDRLLTSMDGGGSTYPGMAQVVADRVTSMRLELENQIPAERVQLVKRTEECQARIDQLEATLKQQLLHATNFDSDLLERQHNAQVATETATAALEKYSALAAAELVSQPLSIVDEFDLAEPSNRLLKTLAVLILGSLASLLSAYMLEAVRLARIGVQRG